MSVLGRTYLLFNSPIEEQKTLIRVFYRNQSMVESEDHEAEPEEREPADRPEGREAEPEEREPADRPEGREAVPAVREPEEQLTGLTEDHGAVPEGREAVPPEEREQ